MRSLARKDWVAHADDNVSHVRAIDLSENLSRALASLYRINLLLRLVNEAMSAILNGVVQETGNQYFPILASPAHKAKGVTKRVLNVRRLLTVATRLTILTVMQFMNMIDSVLEHLLGGVIRPLNVSVLGLCNQRTTEFKGSHALQWGGHLIHLLREFCLCLVYDNTPPSHACPPLGLKSPGVLWIHGAHAYPMFLNFGSCESKSQYECPPRLQCVHYP